MTASPAIADAWAREAALLPIAFSQVREDPDIDAALLAEVAPQASVLMIASGGDTAAWLVARGGISHLQVVDFNAAQLALTKLKLHLLRHDAPAERLALLGHRPMESRSEKLAELLRQLELAPDVLGPPELVGRLGPDYAGRYERLFAELRAELGHAAEWRALLELRDPAEYARRVQGSTALGRDLDAAFAKVWRLENLVCLFGEEATSNTQMSFAAHFLERTREALAQPGWANPFLAQMLLGEFLPGVEYPWLNAPAPRAWPEIEYPHATSRQALAGVPRGSLDLVHLSNILDWLEPAEAEEALDGAWRALRPGGLVCLRQLNSALEIPALGTYFRWRTAQAAAMHAHDRSFFYRALWVGAK
jgi:S-adenosylmethionine-diacylglycerol 3-amino-3-carboxypropyl transferase